MSIAVLDDLKLIDVPEILSVKPSLQNLSVARTRGIVHVSPRAFLEGSCCDERDEREQANLSNDKRDEREQANLSNDKSKSE